MTRETVVLNPGMGVGHLVPMVELGKLFLRHGLAVTVVVNAPPANKSTDTSAAVARAAAANPSMHFQVLLPPVDTAAIPDLTAAESEEPPNPFVLLRLMNAPLRDYLRAILPTVRALVLDMFCFCVDAVDVAAELGVPAYAFYTGSASSLAVNLHLPHMQAQIGDATSFGDIGDRPLSFPGNRPFKPSELPSLALDRGNEVYKHFLHAFQRIPEASRGIVVNTFEWLESKALRALRDGECVPGGRAPPVYCVGPMVSGGGEEKTKKKRQEHECLGWLDAQPEKSVVFLCFGSMGSFPKAQLQEIAAGLERSGQRFLWVVQSPRNDGGPDLLADALAEPDLEALLPEGFVERTAGRGFVAKSWAPQAEVLCHRATGAFVTHCGWNSTLEGIMAGLPLACWPLYAEQKQNKVFVVEEMGAGVEMVGYDEEMVKAAEVEEKVRWVMESEAGQALRERAMAAKVKAYEAVDEGGASRTAFAEFLRDFWS